MQYEYIGQKEMHKRALELGYTLPDLNEFIYISYEGMELLECRKYRLMAQRTGNWLLIVDKSSQKVTGKVYTYYNGKKYVNEW